MIFKNEYSYLEHKNPTVTVIFLLWNALRGKETTRDMSDPYPFTYPFVL